MATIEQREWTPEAVERYCLGFIAGEMGEAAASLGNALRFGLDTPSHAISIPPPLVGGPMPKSEAQVAAENVDDDGDPDLHGEVGFKSEREALAQECGDVLAAIEFAILHGILDGSDVIRAKQKKIRALANPFAKDYLGRQKFPPLTGETKAE